MSDRHAIYAHYDNFRLTRSGGNSPELDCSCGRFFSADSWEEAGSAMDAHLRDVLAVPGSEGEGGSGDE